MLDSVVQNLIDEKREGTYWDFKREYHHNKAKLLHDIICLANNLENRDAYLIFGINDNGVITGIEEDIKRKNQEHFTSFLRGKKFAGGIIPYVVLRTIFIENHEIDVLVIKESDKVPFYLEEQFKEDNTIVHAGSIYSRIEDRNTPINSTADSSHTELLWKIRLGLLPTPIDRLKAILLQKNKWRTNQTGYYFDEAPEFTIVENEEQREQYDKLSPSFYAYNQMNSHMSYSHYECRYYNTILSESQTAILDSGRYHSPIPERGFINVDQYGQESLSYRYFIEDTLLYNLHHFLFDSDSYEAHHARQRFLEIILIFKSEIEKNAFENFIKEDLQGFLYELEYQSEDDLLSDLDTENEREKTVFNIEIKTGKLLVNKLNEFKTGGRSL
ncbi:ATP-binding protein [Salinicoccus jeotgali]|uniref:ATP-binding protein n=1 Tax=Salinicoccus jeotgali TaxID=381634 RepID=A0ABP7EYW0_9STAP